MLDQRPFLIGLAETAAKLGVSHTTLYDMEQRGDAPSSSRSASARWCRPAGAADTSWTRRCPVDVLHYDFMAVPAKKVAQLLRDPIQEAYEDDLDPDNFEGWKERARTALRLAFGEGDPTVARFDDIRYGLAMWTSSTPDSAWAAAREGGVKAGVAIRSAALTEVQLSEPDDVAVDVAQLHPWVSGMAASLWETGRHRIAVQEAARAVEVQLRAKLGLDGGTGSPLVTDAFSTKPPTNTAPRLRFLEHAEGSEPWTNAHEGAMAFGRGCFMRIRNLLQHGQEPDEQEALESLAALSLLARWIAQASVVRAS